MSPARSRTVRTPTPVENDAYGEMMRRCIRALGRRIANGDVEYVGTALELLGELEEALKVGISTLHAKGESWERIARVAGVSRQAVTKRWGLPGLVDGSDAGM